MDALIDGHSAMRILLQRAVSSRSRSRNGEQRDDAMGDGVIGIRSVASACAGHQARRVTDAMLVAHLWRSVKLVARRLSGREVDEIFAPPPRF